MIPAEARRNPHQKGRSETDGAPCWKEDSLRIFRGGNSDFLNSGMVVSKGGEAQGGRHLRVQWDGREDKITITSYQTKRLVVQTNGKIGMHHA